MRNTPDHILGPLFPPAYHRPWLRYFAPADDGAGAGDEGNGGDGHDDNADQGAGDENDDEHIEGRDQLGDAGKQALDRMKASWKEQKRRADAAEARAAAAEAKANGQEQEHEQELEKQKVKDGALAAANDRIKKAEIRTAAKGKLATPADALIFIDLDDIEIDDEGNVDETAIAAAIDDLLTNKPYLAAQGSQRFQGGGDGGARNGGAGPRQLTQDDVEKMTPEQVDKARRAGQLNRLLGADKR